MSTELCNLDKAEKGELHGQASLVEGPTRQAEGKDSHCTSEPLVQQESVIDAHTEEIGGEIPLVYWLHKLTSSQSKPPVLMALLE